MKLWNEFRSAVHEVLTLPFRLGRFTWETLRRFTPQRVAMLLFAAGVITVVISIVFVKATSTPTFCRSCHLMEPYFASWESSSHKNVQCIKCHIPPGVAGTIEGKFVAMSMLVNYATGMYKRSKPWAEIEDVNCTASKCHEERLLSGPVLFKGKIKFDHSKHLAHKVRGKQLRCTSCHSQIVQGAHINVTEATCFLCHFKGRTPGEPAPEDAMLASLIPHQKEKGIGVFEGASKIGCTSCHKAPVATDSANVRYDHTSVLEKKLDCRICHDNMKEGDGEVPHERCSICHASRDHLSRIGDTEFLHQQHVTDRKVDCQNCHTTILHRSKSRAQSPLGSCNGCHSDQHNAAEVIFKGSGAIGVADRPDVMWEAGLDCGSCHSNRVSESHFRTFGPKSSPARCTPCHEPKFEKLVPQWRNAIIPRIRQFVGIVEWANKQKDRSATQDTAVQIAMYNAKLLQNGGGFHNVAYSEDILRETYQILKAEFKNAPPFTVKEPRVKAPMAKATGACISCHPGMEAVGVLVKGSTFPHGKHIGRFQCTTCHQQEPHGKMTPIATSCTECHHKEATSEATCKKCHSTQRAMYEGTLAVKTPIQSAMATAGVECTQCHGVGEKIARPTNAQCVDCHDDTYMPMLRQTQKKTMALVDSAKRVIGNRNTPEVTDLRNRIQLIERDGSKGAHNPELSTKLLKLP